MTDIAKLKQLAQDATPGPWSDDNDSGAVEFRQGVICDCFNNPIDDAAYIAAANPAAILELIAERDERLAALEGLHAAVDYFARNYLIDERDDVEHCINDQHHTDVVGLFNAIERANQAIEKAKAEKS